MKKYPLTEIKELLNETFRMNRISEIMESNIGNYTQVQILKYLLEHENEEVNQKDFERILNIRKSTVSGILDTMEKNKIIYRTSSKIDARGKVVCISKECLDCKREMISTIEDIEKRIIFGISESDLEIFYKVIDKMKANIGKEDKLNDQNV